MFVCATADVVASPSSKIGRSSSDVVRVAQVDGLLGGVGRFFVLFVKEAFHR